MKSRRATPRTRAARRHDMTKASEVSAASAAHLGCLHAEQPLVQTLTVCKSLSPCFAALCAPTQAAQALEPCSRLGPTAISQRGCVSSTRRRVCGLARFVELLSKLAARGADWRLVESG